MKYIHLIAAVGALVWLTGCASQPIALAPVGPSPFESRSSSNSTGHLKVFSSLAEESDNQNQGSKDPVWYQHTDYKVYDARGKLVEHVDNTVGHYSTAARLVSLPVGNYIVAAQASDGLSVNVPVAIEPDRTTKVHLDGNWELPPGTPKTEIVCAPSGYPVGWRADLPIK